jgi:glycosyltransferase involved in cell wall biosynthesis
MKVDSLITVLTPSYNRDYELNLLYDSLCNQTNHNFNWLIIDDGSVDQTKEVVSKFTTSLFDITYVYQDNSGKHKAINSFVDMVPTELLFIVDSDDYLENNAIETVYSDWNSAGEDITGLCYLRKKPNGKIIGDYFSSDFSVSTYTNERILRGIKGDKAELWKTSEFKKYPFLEFKNERFFSEQHKYILLSGPGKILFINKPIYISEYLPGGLSNKIRKLQYENPNGTIANALILSGAYFPLIIRLKSFLKLCAYSHLTDEIFFNRFQKSEFGYHWLIFTPIGILYRFWIKSQYYLMISR